jgi:hypothetical protein
MATRKTTKAVAPKGFRKIENHLAGFWKPELPGQIMQGIVGTAVEVRGVDDKPNTFFSFKITNLESGPVVDKDGKKVKIEEGMMIGVGGAMLLTFLRGREGREVYLSYDGLGPKKPGQSAPRMYLTFERDSGTPED